MATSTCSARRCVAVAPPRRSGRGGRRARRWAGRSGRRGPSARSRTTSAKRERGASASTSPHSTAWRPLLPSVRVAKTSARSRRTWRLSTTRVSPPVPGSTASSGTSGQRDGGGQVVDEDDLVAGQRQLVATARRGAVHGRDPDLAGVRRGVLDAVAGLVGELAEVDLVVVRRPGQHLDVRPGAEHLLDAAGEHDGVDLGVLEAEALDGVGQLDVDGQVVGVELELVVVPQTALGIDLPWSGWPPGRRRTAASAGTAPARSGSPRPHAGRHPIAHGDPQSPTAHRSASRGERATTVDSSVEKNVARRSESRQLPPGRGP